MQSEEQRLIDGLFDRLKAAGENSAPRDADAERWIEQHMRNQPGAAYYMAQTILIQEAAMKQLNGRIQALEAEVAQLKQSASRQQSSGGFLAGLFGGNKSEPEAPRPQATPRGSDPSPARSSTRAHRRQATPRSRPPPSITITPHAAAALWRVPCRPPLAWRAAWCSAIC